MVNDADGRNNRIVWIASYPRSGNTWVRMFFYNLVAAMNGADREQNIYFLRHFSSDDDDRIYYGKYIRWNLQNEVKKIVSVRHLVQRDIANESESTLAFTRTNWLLGNIHGFDTIDFTIPAVAVYIVRNPLDVAVSISRASGKPIDQAIGDMATQGFVSYGDKAATLIGSWSQNVASWTREAAPAICVVRYEDMLSDPKLWFPVIARHVYGDALPGASHIERAIEWSAYVRLRAQEKGFSYAGTEGGFPRLLNKGTTGQWKDALTPAQIERISGQHGIQMKRFGYLRNA